LRALLCAPRQPAPRVRRVEILRAAREAFELLASSFDGSTSAVSRLRAFGVGVVSSEPYRRLVAYLEHDDNLGSLELRVRVGADGEVRAMQLVGVRENETSPFYVSVLRRFLLRIVLLVRGFRTSAGEVAERLLSEVFAGVEEATALLFQLLGDIEVIAGALSFRDRALDRGLAASLPVWVDEREPLELDGLYNPLLLAAGVVPVPCRLAVGPGAIVLVTGPNSGGKTRLLQSVAIAQLLAQVGLFVPARSACLPRASGLFASLFEEARADQPEGHLGMELLRIRRLFDELDSDALVVLDELCSGTNPSEGEQIARLVLSLLPDLGVRAFVTTHLLQLAERLAGERVSGLEFLQVEIDRDERPTYQFVRGVARTSLAQRTAARLGVTREELLAIIAAKRRAKAGH
jgi:DNA mismatch repair protein MutS2